MGDKLSFITGCKGKVKYGHLATAKKAVRAMERKGVDGLVAYKCKHCAGFHIGHNY
jgi:hypothetical protein